jgi:hypothetical protein
MTTERVRANGGTMPEHELIERVARAFWYEEDGLGPEGSAERNSILGGPPVRTWETIPEWERDDYRAAAKAVILIVRGS